MRLSPVILCRSREPATGRWSFVPHRPGSAYHVARHGMRLPLKGLHRAPEPATDWQWPDSPTGRNKLDGTQELCYPPIMQAIAATDWEGYVVHEFNLRDEFESRIVFKSIRADKAPWLQAQ